MNIKLVSGLAAFVLAAMAAQAQTLGANDISVGFTTTSSTNSLEVKAGSVSTLASYTTETLIGNFNTLLNTNLGSTWTSATLDSDSSHTAFWGAQGQSSSTKVYASSAWDISTAGALGTANSTDWQVATASNANTKINSLNSAFSTLAVTTGDGLSRTLANSNANSFKALAIPSNGVAFATFDNPPFAAAASDLAFGQVYSAIDLYEVVAGSSTLLGTFALYTADGLGHVVGDLTFTSAFAAIPEPSTYAAILGAVALAVAIYRRRSEVSLG